MDRWQPRQGELVALRDDHRATDKREVCEPERRQLVVVGDHNILGDGTQAGEARERREVGVGADAQPSTDKFEGGQAREVGERRAEGDDEISSDRGEFGERLERGEAGANDEQVAADRVALERGRVLEGEALVA